MTAAAWALFALAVAVNAAGYALNLWSHVDWFDRPVHAFTMLAVTLLAGVSLRGRVFTRGAEHAVLLALVVAAFGLGLGTLWEFFEYSLDRLLPSPAIAVKGLDDTMLDLVFDAGGTLLAGIAVAWHASRRSHAAD